MNISTRNRQHMSELAMINSSVVDALQEQPRVRNIEDVPLVLHRRMQNLLINTMLHDPERQARWLEAQVGNVLADIRNSDDAFEQFEVYRARTYDVTKVGQGAIVNFRDYDGNIIFTQPIGFLTKLLRPWAKCQIKDGLTTVSLFSDRLLNTRINFVLYLTSLDPIPINNGTGKIVCVQ